MEIEGKCIIRARKKDILTRTNLWLTIIVVISFIKQIIIRKDKDMITISIRITNPVTPSKQVVNVFDLGYLGVEKDFPEQLSSRYHIEGKKPTRAVPRRKRENRIHSSKKRIVIEHTICRLKKYRIMSVIFRNKLRKYNRISDIVAVLINYRILNL
jgi:hypothetical protein